MCGIAGFTGTTLSADSAARALDAFSEAMAHRGPDDAGSHFDPRSGTGLAHRRLSIIDLSPSGHQPMHSEDGRFALVFNGEIYNFGELRSDLAKEGATFRGTSDTEVLLHAMARWGVTEALRRSVGMFALGLWDARDSILYLARDRMGEKPLSVVELDRGFAFASELRTIKAAALRPLTVDRSSLALFLKYGYLPAPHSIYERAWKVAPGTIVAIATEGRSPALGGDWTQDRQHGELSVYTRRYWSPELARDRHLSDSVEETQARFEALLEDAVRLQSYADVPVGAFLSGGIDSSLVCSVAQSQSNRPINTFTMGFGDALFDESGYAQAIADHLGTNHTCVRVTSDDVLDLVPRIADIYDEPFGDPSAIPTYLVSGIAREHVTVCLTGDGGDELFCGYNRYTQPARWKDATASLPRPMVRAAASVMRSVPAGAVDRVVASLAALLRSKRLRVQSPGGKLHKLGDVLTTEDPKVIYEDLITHWKPPSELLLGEPANPTMFADESWDWSSFIRSAMDWDIGHYLPGNNLAKVDRASMAHSLETRLPLLDHRIVELSLSLDPRVNTGGGTTKGVLRRTLLKYLPLSLIERPKMGFSVPIAAWLRGPLKGWASDLLSPAAIQADGLFDAAVVDRYWREHASGSSDHYLRLWLVLVTQSWMQSQ